MNNSSYFDLTDSVNYTLFMYCSIWCAMGRWSSLYAGGKTKCDISRVEVEGAKKIVASVINNATKNDRQLMVEKIIHATMDKLSSKGSPPIWSPGDEHAKYTAGIAYLLHKDLKTIPQERLAEVRKMLIDNRSWKIGS